MNGLQCVPNNPMPYSTLVTITTFWMVSSVFFAGRKVSSFVTFATPPSTQLICTYPVNRGGSSCMTWTTQAGAIIRVDSVMVTCEWRL